MIFKVFVDTNVVLDLLMKREPFNEFAEKIFALAAYKKIHVYISALSFSTVHYVLAKKIGAKNAIQTLKELKVFVTVLSVDDNIIELALNSHFKDFEDAIQYYCAATNNLKTIVTRDTKDFKNNEIAVLTPQQYLSSHIHH